MGEPLERWAVISGAAQSDIGRRLYRTGIDLTVEAALRAVADAGLTAADIDGVSTYPGFGGSFGGATGAELHEALRLSLNWRSAGVETAGPLGAVHNAVLAVAAGLARHVLVFRTVVEGSDGPLRPGGGRGGGGGGGMTGSAGPFQFMIPYGAASAACWVACYARRHMHDYGTTRTQLGAIAVNGRANAAANPKAIYTDPMTIDDYLAVRMVSEPLCLYDCDVPCDGSTAVVVSHRDYAPDAPDVASILDIFKGTTRLRQFGGSIKRRVEQTHRHAYDVEAFSRQERGGDRRVDSAAHGDKRALFLQSHGNSSLFTFGHQHRKAERAERMRYLLLFRIKPCASGLSFFLVPVYAQIPNRYNP